MRSGRSGASAGRWSIAPTACPATKALRTSVVDLEPDAEGWTAILADDDGTRRVSAARVIIAPGAQDRPVVFPGWTLPGVLTAGGLQTLAKTQRFLPGRRMVFAGSGPVALAFPAQLADFGADIARRVGGRSGAADPRMWPA